ncbi:DUF488 family protein [Arthrobacter sp. MYb213]|uniref:DUF488 domain-containing protein n=1 Tax=Arthrobacter sp. MYb213 TaxID=1848595 RepID=UPI000CFA8DA6|nr:DUF488 family protein [Arthrobacter sp. MYb213]PRB67129.1 MarR family transcriptional regulator [Arthrobacter sp. MYb213]
MAEIRLKRAYVAAEEPDGYRILVDRLWPRGQTKEVLKLDRWAKGIAPSSELRKAWHHDADRFSEFAEHYRQELNQNPAVDEFLELVEAQPVVTFVYAAKDEQINHAMVLRDFLREQLVQ